MTCVLIVHHRDLQRQRAIFHAEVFSTMNNYCCSKEFSISHAFVYQSINKYFLSKMCGGHERGTRLSYCLHRGWVDKPNVEAWSSTSESGASGTYLPFEWNWIALTISSIKLVNWRCLESPKSGYKWPCLMGRVGVEPLAWRRAGARM